MKKKILILLIVVLVLGGIYLVRRNNLFGTISHVETTDTIGTLRTTVNSIIDSIQNTTSTLGAFASLSSSTGNLIVGSSTQFTVVSVGANGRVLTASSTAKAGVSWEQSTVGVTLLQAGSGISVNNGTGTVTVTNIGVTSLSAGQNILLINSTGTVTVGVNVSFATATITTATTTLLNFADATHVSTGYKESGFTVLNATGTVSSSILAAKLFYGSFKLSNLDCSTNGASVTIWVFTRVSSTPATNGTTTLSGIVCPSGGTSTTTFTNANFGPNQYLVFSSSSVGNATTTLNMSFKYSEQ